MMSTLAGRKAATEVLVDRPRVLFVGNTNYSLPLSAGLARKWDSVSQRVELRIIGPAGVIEQEDPRFHLAAPFCSVSGIYHISLPWIVAREVRRFRPDVLITQSPYEALPILAVRPILRGNPKLVVEVHGDWRTASRLYGSGLRHLLAPVLDRAALVALRRADGTRAISNFTTALVEAVTSRKPLSVYPTYTDLESFVAHPSEPLPRSPTVAWIGTLQPVKDPETFAAAWRVVAARVPEARAIVVGDGPLRPVIDALVAEFPERVRALPRLSPPEVATVLDDSTLLALSSRSEGMGRVVIEAFSRGRPVVGSAVGGVPDMVRNEHNGLLVPPRDPTALADALVRVLSDRALADRLAAGALSDATGLQWMPERWADAVLQLAQRAVALD